MRINEEKGEGIDYHVADVPKDAVMGGGRGRW
jgi:hypothetical protein